jgi:class 3 adenylate cyclase
MVTLLEENDASALQKTQREVAILFVDIEGCTTLCENLPPEDMNDLLEFYFSHFFDVIQECGGTVNEIMGDGFMAIFEGKHPEENIRDAVAAAVGIGKMVSRLKGQRLKDHYDTQVHIGVHAGAASVGFTKFRAKRWERWTYTASGPVTNIAARLCHLAPGGSIIMSSEIAEVVQDQYPLVQLGPHKLKNVNKPVLVYELRVEH